MGGIDGLLFQASTWVLPVLLAITLHEAAHGFVAWKLGDDTAYVRGRVTFNPIRHVDPMGTVVLPGLLLAFGAPFLFGWAKPVPVNFARLTPPRFGMIAVAIAGPGTNAVLAILSAALIPLAPLLPETFAQWAQYNLYNSILINLVLMVLNMLPLPPLDGGRVAVGLLPRGPAMALARLEPAGLFILIGVIFLLPMLGREFGQDWNVFAVIIGEPVRFLATALLQLAGAL